MQNLQLRRCGVAGKVRGVNDLTDEKKNEMDTALGKLIEFVESSEASCFVLRGSAGTGKTTLIGKLAGELESRKLMYYLIAPTGRAARILSKKTGRDASTIHSLIYRFSSIEEVKDGDDDRAREAEALASSEAEGAKVRFHFPLKSDGPGNAVIIVDEASMVGDTKRLQDILFFGSGRLLNDLITYARIKHGGANTLRAKIVFVGDYAQLPPVGDKISPALSKKYLSKTYGIECADFTLTQVFRQAENSAILQQATAIRKCIDDKVFQKLYINPVKGQIAEVEVSKAIDFMTETFQKCDGSAVMITGTNADALQFNQAIRGRMYGDDNAPLRAGDLLLVNKNSRSAQLLNGDLVRVTKADDKVEERVIRLAGQENPVSLKFRNVVLEYETPGNHNGAMPVKILENLLDSGERDLLELEQQALFVDFIKRNPNLKSKTSEFVLALASDQYFNALQVKYGYAITCHKAQGGEWDTVVAYLSGSANRKGEEHYRWTYTAITRAKTKLLTIGGSGILPMPKEEKTKGEVQMSVNENNLQDVFDGEDYSKDPDYTRFGFDSCNERLFLVFRAVRAYLTNADISIESVEHKPFRERIAIAKNGVHGTVDYFYRKNYELTRFEQTQGTGENAVAAEAAEMLNDEMLKGPQLSDHIIKLVRYIEDAVRSWIEDTDFTLVKIEPKKFAVRAFFIQDIHNFAIDFIYNGCYEITNVREVGNDGASRGLVERLRDLEDN